MREKLQDLYDRQLSFLQNVKELHWTEKTGWDNAYFMAIYDILMKSYEEIKEILDSE